jgi:purine-cytosine permease-like protein
MKKVSTKTPTFFWVISTAFTLILNIIVYWGDARLVGGLDVCSGKAITSWMIHFFEPHYWLLLLGVFVLIMALKESYIYLRENAFPSIDKLRPFGLIVLLLVLVLLTGGLASYC